MRFKEDQPDQIGIYEHLDEYIPKDVVFYNQDSVAVNLNQLVDKPTVISFVYYTCPGLCSPMLGGIAEVMERADSRTWKRLSGYHYQYGSF